MCGICAYFGQNATTNVIENLKKLDYRGYDSCGISYLSDGKIEVCKTVGDVENLKKFVRKNSSKISIGHTRWATHGSVTVENSHPQLSESGKFAIVHNGIVENFESLRRDFLQDVSFNSQTDTEVFVNLIEKENGSVLEKLKSACSKIVGSFAIALLHEKEEKIYFAKRDSPLMIACENDVCMAGSDMAIFAEDFDFCYVMEDDEFAVLDEKNAFFYDKNGEKIEKKPHFLKKECFQSFENYDGNFMQKEIEQQPEILHKTFLKFFDEKIFSEDVLQKLRKFDNFHFIACGTALHSAMLGAKFVREICKKNSVCDYASEFRYAENIFGQNTLYVFVSQSGETADTLACAKMIKEKGLSSLCVTNVAYSSLNSLCCYVLPTFAGREVAVASTKAYTAQIFSMLCFFVLLAKKEEKFPTLQNFVENVKIQKIDEFLCEKVLKFEKIFFIGREKDFVTALEASLKLKEISYVNCQALPAGELKHGSLALVDEKTLVVAISTCKSLKNKLENNVVEVKSRAGKVLLLSQFDCDVPVDFFIKLPEFDELLMPISSIFPLQNLALTCSKILGNNPDRPRNLAKSVTVE